MKRFVLVACVGLSGCGLTAEEEMRERLEKVKALTGTAILICKEQGLKDNTPELQNCASSLAESQYRQEQIDDERRRAAIANALDGMSRNIQNQQMINSMNRPINCTSNSSFGTVYTNCR